MGIVAFCPKGHRIKVKDALAGRKGICPTCSARFRIPLAAAAPPDAGPAAGTVPPMATFVSLDPLVAAALPVASAVTDADACDAVDAVPEMVESMPDPAPAVLDERPELRWYVAVRGGTPSAPLDAAALRDWLGSGAASSDHVVWRQDWPDWRPLPEVFPDALPPGPPLVP